MCSATPYKQKIRWLQLPAALVLVVCGLSSALAQDVNRNRYLIVDCVLPPQLVRNGRFQTYPRPRPPIKTDAHDCELRGGRYIADRDYNTALEVWLDPAIEGDPQAQANVGEIFEKGLGRQPDYEQAAYWYQLAAESGNSRAQVNLGHLYERGLGVEQDPVLAVEWYRRATGLNHNIDIDTDTEAADESAQLETLRAQVATLNAETEALRDALTNARSEAGMLLEERRELEEIADAAQREQAAAEAASVRALSGADDLSSLEAQLDARRRQTAELEALSLALQQALEESRAELEANQLQLRTQMAELEDSSSDLQSIATQTQARRDELQAMEADYADRETALNEAAERLAALQEQTIALEVEAEERRSEIETLRTQRVAMAEGVLAGPEIRLIEPPAPVTRGVSVVASDYSVITSTLVGQVRAPAGLIALTINGEQADFNDMGVFRFDAPEAADRMKVEIRAVDQQGKSAALELEMVTPAESAGERQASSETRTRAAVPDVEFGRYHALLIGNNDYQHMPRLRSAVADAEVIGKILSERYGFEVEILNNATEDQILSKLNEYRHNLTSEDNFLLYYAGHGNLDTRNNRGHWLPIDARAQDTTNWISVDEVTDLLHWMSASQILVIADSCYSASLTRSSEVDLSGGRTDRERRQWLEKILEKKARVAITSGGLAPVLDGPSTSHSVFAGALIDALQSNDALIDGSALHEQIRYAVTATAADQRFEQLPEYAPIRTGGHEGGSFFFVPTL